MTDGVDEDVAAQKKALDEAASLNARLWTVAIECEISERSPLRSQAAHYCRFGGAALSDGATVTLIAGAA